MRHNELSIIILAAGAGTRMKSNLPKVLHRISGKPMLYYSIFEALKISNDITIVLYNQAEVVEKQMRIFFENMVENGILKFAIQDVKNYPGTGGAVMNIVPKYEKTLVLNADMPLVCSDELLKFLNFDSTIVMSVLNLKNANGYGRVVIKDEKVVKIVEQKDASQSELSITTANAGVYLFNTNFLIQNVKNLNNDNAQKEYYITDLIELAIKKDLTLTPLFVDEENFKGVNSKYELSQAEEISQNRIKKAFMDSGVIMKLPQTIYIETGVEIEGESIIENGVTLLGNTKIINSHIKTNSIVENSIIEDSIIGPVARIRPQSIVKSSHIGNFVELKKAELKGVKAGHLSYLGDCFIDEGTNVGCGTITCNYDGVKKHKTTIGKNVFIGSDTQLVAPLNIEDDVIIAAGTTVTKNIKCGHLAISRTPLKTIKEYFYKKFSTKSEHPNE